MDLTEHLTRQMAFSRATWGPGARTNGIVSHIKQELGEVRDEVREGNTHAASLEWTDVVLLALDGLTRSISVKYPDRPFDWCAEFAVEVIVAKQGKNELREWPDWRTLSEDVAINHKVDAKTCAGAQVSRMDVPNLNPKFNLQD